MNPSKPAPTKNKLDTVTALFQQWRSQQAGRRAETPPELRIQVLALQQEYPRSQIVKTLGINHTMLKQWQASALPVDNGSPFYHCPSRQHRPTPFVS